MVSHTREFIKKIAFQYTSLGAPKFDYNVEPIQLAELINAIERTKDKSGSIVEIGVARGMTTRFLAEHIVNQGYDFKLYAIDTFSSFEKEDVQYEISHRGKVSSELKGFAYNDYETWKKNFAEFPFVQAIEANASIFDYENIGPFTVAFLDVDLYIPTKNSLGKIYANLVPGGTILVDDCKPNNQWDGALQAYMEFMSELDGQPEIVGTKCGIIRKPE